MSPRLRQGCTSPLVTRTALVTSVGSGIGKAITSRIAAEGCVVIADLNPDSLGRRSVRESFPWVDFLGDVDTARVRS